MNYRVKKGIHLLECFGPSHSQVVGADERELQTSVLSLAHRAQSSTRGEVVPRHRVVGVRRCVGEVCDVFKSQHQSRRYDNVQ